MCLYCFLLNKHLFTKKINYKPQAEAATAPPSIPSAVAAAAAVDRQPPAADRRPPTADRQPSTAPPQAGQAHLKPTSPTWMLREGADGRRETIEGRAFDAADDLVVVCASMLRVGKNKRF